MTTSISQRRSCQCSPRRDFEQPSFPPSCREGPPQATVLAGRGAALSSRALGSRGRRPPSALAGALHASQCPQPHAVWGRPSWPAGLLSQMPHAVAEATGTGFSLLEKLEVGPRCQRAGVLPRSAGCQGGPGGDGEGVGAASGFLIPPSGGAHPRDLVKGPSFNKYGHTGGGART